MSKRNVTSKDGRGDSKPEETLSHDQEEHLATFQNDLDETMNSFNEDSTKLEIVKMIQSL